MRRITKIGVAIAAAPLLLAACSSGSQTGTTGSGAGGASTSAAAGGGSGGTLVVWADNSANTAKAIEPLCLKWASANGVTCTVKKFNGGDDLKAALTKGNATGDVPDIFEAPHDQIGGYVKDGILAPIDISANVDKFSKVAVAGVTYSGNTYGVPWAVENIALYTNKTESPTCPATMDAAVATAKALIASGKATSKLGIAMQMGSTGDAYHWYPLFTADGGYSFKQNSDGTFDPKDLGIANAGAIAAGNHLKQLVADGMMGPNVSYDIARASFSAGKSPFFISGPWQLPDQKKALGSNLMVCPIPAWQDDTNKAQPFVGIRTFMQPAKAKNAALAATFLNDAVMTTDFMDGMYSVDPRPPAWTESFAKASSDPYIKAFGEFGEQGIPIPNIPQMAAVFSNLGLAEFKIASGSADPTTALTQAATATNTTNAALG